MLNTNCMRLTKVFLLSALLAGGVAMNSCSNKVDVTVVSKPGLAMDGNQLVPAKTVSASGVLDVEYNKDLRTLYYKVSFTNLSGAPTSIGVYGTAKKGFSAGNTALQNFTTALPAGTTGTYVNSLFIDGIALTESALFSGEYYVMIKTAANTTGEIRGQVEF